MRILFITPRFPYPPLKGDTLRVYHQIRALHGSGHTITLLSLTDAPVPQADLDEVSRYCEHVEVVRLSRARSLLNMGLGLFSPLPLQVSYYLSDDFRNRLAERLQLHRYDAIHVALIRMLPYVRHLAPASPPVTVDLIDSLTLNLDARRKQARPFLKPAYWMEHRRVRRYEQDAVLRFPMLAVSSPADQEELLGSGTSVAQGNVKVIPNGVDLAQFPFADGQSRGTDTIIFTGNMGYGPNEAAVLWFVDQVWPLLRRRHPHLRFQVVGTNPGQHVQQLATFGLGVEVLGRVPDVGEYLRQATIAVAPMHSGSGIQNKVLEAMSSGAPVVSTSIGNRGVGAEHRQHLMVADTPEDFARALLDLLSNSEQLETLAIQARAYVEAHFRWESHVEQLSDLYEAGRSGSATQSASLLTPEHTGSSRQPMHRLKVMQMTDVTGRGGAEKSLADITLHLDKTRTDVVVCATRSAGNYQPLLDDAGVTTFVQGRAGRWDFVQWFKLIQLMRRENVDILHTHLFGSNTLGRLLGRLGGVPLIISHEHWSTISPLRARIDRLLHRLSDRILVPSEASKRLVSQVEGISPDRISVLYNGVDTSTHKPPTQEERAGARRQLNIPGDAFLIGMLGRLSPEKGGVDHLIRVVHSLRKTHPSSHLVIIGDGPLRPDLEVLATQLDAASPSPVVTFAGTRQDVPRMLGALDLFVLPSLNEALPIVLLEAMAVGLPVVATRVGGVPEIVEDGANGLLVPPGDEEALETAIAKLIDDDALRSSLSSAGLERVRREFTIEQMVRRVEELYAELYAGKARIPRRGRLVTRHS